jgi:hypothetical protein
MEPGLAVVFDPLEVYPLMPNMSAAASTTAAAVPATRPRFGDQYWVCLRSSGSGKTDGLSGPAHLIT